MAKKKEEVKLDTLANRLAADLNKHFKEQVAFSGAELSPADVTDWVSTGSSMLDLAISNRPHGGFPVGRISEITGWEASGKSLLAAHAIVSTQRKGGLGVYIDTENAVSREFFEAIGVDYDAMMYTKLANIEDAFYTVDRVIDLVRRENKDQLVTIIIDSVMGATTKTEAADNFEKKGWNTDKSIIISAAMRKLTNVIGEERICLICTNQLREKLGVMFGDKSTTSGGKAIGFHASVRVKLQGKSNIKVEGIPMGIQTKATIFKNRLGPPLRSVEYDIYFNSGIDDWGSWLSVLKEHDLVNQKEKSPWYEYDGIKFQSKDFYSKILEDPARREEVYRKICDAVIMEYKVNENFGIDDVEISDLESDPDYLPEQA